MVKKINDQEDKFYFQNKAEVVKKDGQFEHLMALTLSAKDDNREGIIRCIKSRDGEVDKKGFIDKSDLHKIIMGIDGIYHVGENLNIENSKEIIASLKKDNYEFLGLEDPDIWIDEKNKLLHLYFTIPFLDKKSSDLIIHLGHAEGVDFDNLVMTRPVLIEREGCGAKELSIAPLNKNGVRYNLVESSDHGKDFWYSTIRVAIAKDMGASWKFGETIFHPKENDVIWASEHASPGPFIPSEFINVGEGKCLGFMNGREQSVLDGETKKYGKFSVGLFIYDYEKAKIDWVSPESLIFDSQAKTITFASQFVINKDGKGTLYAHIDDSFIRSYEITKEGITKFIQKFNV